MQILQAVNWILPKLGEHPVTNLNPKHPTLAIILPSLERLTDNVLRRGWWFNVYRTTIYPDSEGYAFVPNPTLEFLPDEPGPVTRGERFFNTKTATWKFDKPFSGEIKIRVPFEQIPESVAEYITSAVLADVYATDIGAGDTAAVWDNYVEAAETAATAEHLRNMRYNTKKLARYRRIRGAMRG